MSVHVYMFRFLLAASFACACVLGTSLVASTPAQAEPLGVLEGVQGKASEVFDDMFQRVDFRTLPNGLRVVLYRRGMAPVFAGAVVVRVGGSDEPLGETGISHMFEHMAFKGTPQIGTINFDREQELLDELELLAPKEARTVESQDGLSSSERARWEEIHAELRRLWVSEQFTREYERRGSVGLNATTDVEMTKYFVSLPRREFEFWLRMESERILRPVMRQFYQERDVVMEERRMRYDDDPKGKLYELLKATAFLAHPYRNPVIGHPFDIRSLTATKLEAFRKRFYVPSNIAVALVGDVRPETDWPLIEQYFGQIPASEDPTRPTAVEPEQLGERRATISTKASPLFYAAYHKKQYPHPDDPPTSIMLEMLAGSQISPLQRTLVQRKRLATSVSYSEGPGNVYPNLMLFAVQPRAPHTNSEVLDAFDRAIEEFIKSGITEERLNIAKRAVATSYFSELVSNSSMARNLATSLLVYDDWKAPFIWYEKAMAATLSDIQRVARQYLNSKYRTVAMLEREDAGRVDRDEADREEVGGVER